LRFRPDSRVDIDVKPRVSIIIPHWNHREVLADCLSSLNKTTFNAFQVIIVDNASEDDSVAYIQEHHPGVILIQNEENLGFAGGCNVGLARADTEFVVILNNDTTLEPEWLTHLVQFMDTHPNVGIAQPKLLNALDPEHFDYSGAAGGYMDIYGFPFARGRIYETVEPDRGQYDTPANIFWASGTACILRNTVIEQVGHLDEVFFAHMEEIDLNWRAHLAGWQVAAVPDAIVYHHSGYTLPPASPLKKYLNHRNSLLMLLGNYRLWNMISRGFQRGFLDGLALLFTLVGRDFDRSLAIIRAWAWLVAHIPTVFRKRKQVRSIRKLSDSEVESRMYQASIALEYYLLRRKTWDQRRHGIDEL